MNFQEKRKLTGEYLFIKDMITSKYPGGVVSLVSDTFDFWKTITIIAPALKEEILARVPDQFGLAKVVFRPDSGDPVKIICGDSSTTPGSPEYKGAIECLAEVFGTTVNVAGYKTLNPRVGMIYGDSITLERADAILRQLADKGYAADNIVFGIGSFTFQYTTRDSLGFAMKATYVEIANEGRAIFKDPKTDNGTKRSARGLLRVRQVNGNFVLDNDVTPAEEASPENCLQTVFLNGKLTKFESLQDIRDRLNAQR